MARSAAAYSDEFLEVLPGSVGANIVWVPAERRSGSKVQRLHKPAPQERATVALTEDPRVGAYDLSKALLANGTIEAIEDPRWLAPTVSALTRILELRDGWNSYGAPRIQRRAVNTVLELLGSSAQADSPVPIVVPTTDGGVQLEWHAWGLDVELEVSPGEAPQLFFRDRRSNEIQEDELTTDLVPLFQALKLLAERAAQEAGR